MSLTLFRRMLVAGVLVSGTLATSACAPDEPKSTPTPTSTAIFASEDDALQAAIDVYQKFNAAYDSYLSGEQKRDSLRVFMTADYWQTYSAEDALESAGLHTEGTSRFYNERLVDYQPEAASAQVTIAFCRDVSEVRIINDAGDDMTPGKRADFVPSAARMSWNASKKALLISELGSWDDSSICS